MIKKHLFTKEQVGEEREGNGHVHEQLKEEGKEKMESSLIHPVCFLRGRVCLPK